MFSVDKIVNIEQILCMAPVFIQALLLLVFVIVVFVCIMFVVVSLYIAHVHRKYGHLPGPPYHR